MKTAHLFSRLSVCIASFNLLSTAELDKLVHAFKPLCSDRNQLLVSSSESNQRLYFVADGLIRQYSMMHFVDKPDIMIDRGFVLPTHFILSAASFQTTNGHALHAETIKRTFLLYIERKVLDQLFVEIPVIKLVILHIMEQYFFELERLNVILHISNCQMRYEYFCFHFAEHIQQVPNKYIAQFLNISHSELSRIRNRMAKGEQLYANHFPPIHLSSVQSSTLVGARR
jgi:hypothetical protein